LANNGRKDKQSLPAAYSTPAASTYAQSSEERRTTLALLHLPYVLRCVKSLDRPSKDYSRLLLRFVSAGSCAAESRREQPNYEDHGGTHSYAYRKSAMALLQELIQPRRERKVRESRSNFPFADLGHNPLTGSVFLENSLIQ
jgi:hypothetical protein